MKRNYHIKVGVIALACLLTFAAVATAWWDDDDDMWRAPANAVKTSDGAWFITSDGEDFVVQ